MTVAEVERIGAPDISRSDARRAFVEYRNALFSERNEQMKAEYKALMQGYKAIAAGQQVLDLQKVMKAAGLQPETHYPKLAICRADGTKCYVELWANGSATMTHMRDIHYRNGRAPSHVIRFPEDTFERYTQVFASSASRPATRPQGWSDRASALMPMVPPHLRPPHGLSNYHILWDAVWTPEPPKDPLLLKHLGGSLYAILAHWDLTPLEQAVMRGRL